MANKGKLLLLISAAILLIALCSCSGLYPGSPELPSEPTQTYLAVDQIIPSEVIKAFLTHKVGASAYGGTVFSAYQIMGTHKDIQSIKLYLWALVQEYYLNNAALTEGTATSEPVVLFIKMQAGSYQIFDFKDAGEGYQYLTVNFPPNIQALINLPANAYNQRVTQLSNENSSATKAYFGLK